MCLRAFGLYTGNNHVGGWDAVGQPQGSDDLPFEAALSQHQGQSRRRCRRHHMNQLGCIPLDGDCEADEAH
jgi:hypothetical protein